MHKLEYVPNGLPEIMSYYGTPGRMINGHFQADQKWKQDNLQYFGLPFPLRQSWDQKEIRGFWIHRKVGPAMVDALEEIWGLYGLGRMQHHNLDQWGGCYNPRMKTGANELSTHAWAIAIDFLPKLGPYGEPSRVPWPVVEAFRKRGFVNLQGDAMHHQAAGDEY